MSEPTNWQSALEWAKVIISCATFFSIAVAYSAYRANLKKIAEDRARDSDKELLAQVKNSFEWAYDVLTDEGKNIPPKANRLSWLTCARHLLRAEKLVKQISSPTYRTIYAEIEEYWRNKFYLALSDESLRYRQYYADETRPEAPVNIEITSALVIIGFSQWKDGVADPTKEVDRAALINSVCNMVGVGAAGGLSSYIRYLDQIREQRKASRNESGAPSSAPPNS
jgi:hypothetical protein